VLGVLAVAVLFFGLWPQPLVDMMQASVDHLLQHIIQTKVI
jgi:NADH-quinone oxidoreductase subunit M